jgi:hypothetical protein
MAIHCQCWPWLLIVTPSGSKLFCRHFGETFARLLKMKTECSSETSATQHASMQCQHPNTERLSGSLAFSFAQTDAASDLMITAQFQLLPAQGHESSPLPLLTNHFLFQSCITITLWRCRTNSVATSLYITQINDCTSLGPINGSWCSSVIRVSDRGSVPARSKGFFL